MRLSNKWEVLLAVRRVLTHNFLHKEVHVSDHEWGSCFLWVPCVWAFDLPYDKWLPVLNVLWSSMFFAILLFTHLSWFLFAIYHFAFNLAKTQPYRYCWNPDYDTFVSVNTVPDKTLNERKHGILKSKLTWISSFSFQKYFNKSGWLGKLNTSYQSIDEAESGLFMHL